MYVSLQQRNLVKGNHRRIRAIRHRLKLTQGELGELLGVSWNTVARWERADLVPPRVAELATEYLLLTHKPKGKRKR